MSFRTVSKRAHWCSFYWPTLVIIIVKRDYFLLWMTHVDQVSYTAILHSTVRGCCRNLTAKRAIKRRSQYRHILACLTCSIVITITPASPSQAAAAAAEMMTASTSRFPTLLIVVVVIFQHATCNSLPGKSFILYIDYKPTPSLNSSIVPYKTKLLKGNGCAQSRTVAYTQMMHIQVVTFILSQLRYQNLSSQALDIVFNARILSGVTYGLPAFARHLSAVDKNRIEFFLKTFCRRLVSHLFDINTIMMMMMFICSNDIQ